VATTASSDARYVVGVAGAAGAGKTSLVQALVAELVDAAAIHIDSYQRITREPIRKIVQWMERGANFDEFAIPLLPEHLEELRQGRRVLDPVGLHEIMPRKYILFETHFGRAHRATGNHIDLLLWIDTPHDIALARNVKDMIRPLLRGDGREPPGDRVAWIYNYLESYLADVRRLVLLQQREVRAGADVILDGGQDCASLARAARAEILTRLP
jgi:uridine kinase